jgi:hypothetical protein
MAGGSRGIAAGLGSLFPLWRSVKQLQLDELHAVLREVKTGARSEDVAIERLERSPA